MQQASLNFFASVLLELPLNLVGISEGGEKMNHSILAMIPLSRTYYPFGFGCFGFLEIYQNRHMNAWEKVIIDDVFVVPLIISTYNIIVFASVCFQNVLFLDILFFEEIGHVHIFVREYDAHP